MQCFLNSVTGIANESGFVGIMENPGYLIMIIVACGLIYLAIGKQFEPLLLLPIAFGMLLANLPFGEIIHMQYFIPPEGADPSLYPMFSEILHHGGLADMLYLGVKLGIYPPLIFLGIGTMTDFGPLISNPKSLLLGAAAQLGIFTTYIGAKLLNFTGPQAGAIGIIGGYLTGVLMLHINEGAYLYRIASSVTMNDVAGGFIKSLVFGLLVATVCCHQGYTTHMRRDSVGPEAVGNATTSAVVISCVLILVADYVLTSFLL